MLQREDYERAADRLGCEVATVYAVVDVESAGAGFLDDGRCKILFEAHWFSRFTGGKYDLTHPQISSPFWDRALYIGGGGEWARLNAAIALDAEAALKSASWGLFQIMGFNHAKCGFDKVTDFVDVMKRSEAEHLDAFVAFVISAGLDDELRRMDWSGFAYGYNGAGYLQNRYDERLAAAYKRFSGKHRTLRLQHRGSDVKALQRAINNVAEYRPALEVDGIFGPATAEAVTFVQLINGLPATGVADAATRAVLNMES